MSGKGGWYVVAQAVLILAALLAPLGVRSDSWHGAVVAVGILLATAGLGIVAIAAVTLGERSLTPFPKPKEEAVLVQHGIFSVVRHPIYSGFIVFILGWGLAWSSVASMAGALVLLVFFDIKARREERWLEAKFADYADYKRRVRKLLPLIY